MSMIVLMLSKTENVMQNFRQCTISLLVSLRYFRSLGCFVVASCLLEFGASTHPKTQKTTDLKFFLFFHSHVSTVYATLYSTRRKVNYSFFYGNHDGRWSGGKAPLILNLDM